MLHIVEWGKTVFYRVSGRVLLLATVVAIAWIAWPRSSVSGQPVERLPAPVAEVKYFGTSSCSSMACHHFNGFEGAARSEYSTWANADKHSQAFNVLYNDRSTRITKNLRGSQGPHATEDALCLKCHATNDGKLDHVGERFNLSDGVSCEACHGPAHQYLTSHYQSGFKELSPEVKQQRYGLTNTKSLVKRAEMCITCHVGDGSKEVNHDLIAAGHPRLNFELAGYHGIYHKHWSDLDEKKRNPDHYSRIWLIGQLVSAKAAVDLLKARADGSIVSVEKVGKPWPEFSEYACYACHKDLEVNSPRQRVGYAGRMPGSFPYGTWYLTSLLPLVGQPGGLPKELNEPIVALTNSMQQSSPSAADVSKSAKQLSDMLAKLIDEVEKGKPLDTARVRGLMSTYLQSALKKTGRSVIVEESMGTTPAKTREGFRIDEMDWDEATQLYLSLAALSQALSDVDAKQPPLIRKDMLEMKSRLKGAFPPGYDSPQGYDPIEKPGKGIRSMKDHLDSIYKLLGS